MLLNMSSGNNLKEGCDICRMICFERYKIDSVTVDGMMFSLCGYRCDHGNHDTKYKDIIKRINDVHELDTSYRCRKCLTVNLDLQNLEDLNEYLIPELINIIQEYLYNAQHSKLCELLNICDDVFEEISNVRAIGGNAVAYALNSYIPKDSIEKIDIFVQKKDRNFINDILCRELYDCMCEFPGLNIYNSNLITSYYPLPFIKIHAFNTPEENEEDLITPKKTVLKFNMDHEKCYYHQGEFWISDEAQQAFDTKHTSFETIVKEYNTSEMHISAARKMGFTVVEKNK